MTDKNHKTEGKVPSLPQLLAAERVRLLSYFRRFGASQDAEDLYQELALRILSSSSSDTVRDPRAWVYGVAWRVLQGRRSEKELAFADADQIPSDADPYYRLERWELQTHLKECLEALDEENRQLLVDHHVLGVGLRELAGQHQSSPNALAARLVRSRSRVLKNLKPECAQVLSSHGVRVPSKTTSIWCPKCGEARLQSRFSCDFKSFALSCPHCADEPLFAADGRAAARFQGNPREALSAFLHHSRRNFQQWLSQGTFPCVSCGRTSDGVHTGVNGSLKGSCGFCHGESHYSNWGIALSLPATLAFWNKHGRIRQEIASDESELRFVSRDGQSHCVPLSPTSLLPS